VEQEPEEPDYPFKGYPRVVKLSKVPDNMRWAFDGNEAVAVAPGVWTEYPPGVTPMEAAMDGGFYGYCASVAKAEREFGESRGGMCW
jgi:hypothetical protein